MITPTLTLPHPGLSVSHILLLDTGDRKSKRVGEDENSNTEARISKQIRISNDQNSEQ